MPGKYFKNLNIKLLVFINPVLNSVGMEFKSPQVNPFHCLLNLIVVVKFIKQFINDQVGAFNSSFPTPWNVLKYCPQSTASSWPWMSIATLPDPYCLSCINIGSRILPWQGCHHLVCFSAFSANKTRMYFNPGMTLNAIGHDFMSYTKATIIYYVFKLCNGSNLANYLLTTELCLLATE